MKMWGKTENFKVEGLHQGLRHLLFSIVMDEIKKEIQLYL